MSKVDEIVAQAKALGGRFVELVAPSLECRARAYALAAELESLRKHEESSYPELVELVAAGKLEPSKLPSHTGGLAVWKFGSPASEIVHQSVGLAHASADDALTVAGPAIWAELVARADGCVAESVQLVAKKLPRTVNNESSAFKSESPEVAQTWHRLRALVDHWDQVHALAWQLMSTGVVPGPAHNLDLLPARWVKFERPDLLPRNYSRLAGELKLAQAKAAGAQPGLYDWATACKRWRKWARNAEVGSADYNAAHAVPMQRVLASDEIDPMTGMPWKGLPADAVAEPGKVWAK